MAACIIKSIQHGLDHLQFCMKRSNDLKASDDSKKMRAVKDVICRLRCLGPFAICSTKLDFSVEPMSLWVRLDDVVGRILDDDFSHHSACGDAVRFLNNMESFVEEMDKCFIVLSDWHSCLQQSSLVLDDLTGSVVENFKDFLVSLEGDKN